MQEVRVESLENLEMTGGEMRLSANAGDLNLVFPREVWEKILAGAPAPAEPGPEELEELERLKEQLRSYAEEHDFNTILDGVQCGDSDLEYDLVLRPSGLYAVTTGYHFAPVVRPDLMARLGVALEEDNFVEQAYVIGGVADPMALAAGDDIIKALSIRERRCSSSRFELAPELWQVLSERLGWSNVRIFTTRERDI